MVTAANSTIQNPSMVGTALKTVSMRLRGVSEDGEDVTNLLPTLDKQFNAIGLTLKKDENTFKSTYEIFNDLSKVWNDLTDMQQANIVELVAGKRQGNIASAMMTNWKDAQDALETGLNSMGSATEEFGNYQDSLEYKINRLKNIIVEFWQTNLNTDSFKQLVDAGASLVELITKITDKFGLIPPIVAVVSTAFFMLSKNALGTFYNQLLLVGTGLGVFNLTLKESGIIATITTSAFTALGAVIKTLFPVAIITALSFAITKLTSNLFDNSSAWDSNAESVSEYIKSTQNNINQVDVLISKLQDSNISLQEQHDIQAKLAEILPEATTGYNEQGQAIATNIDLVKELNRQKTQELKDQAIITIGKYDIDDELDNYKRLVDERENINKRINTLISGGDTARINTVLPRLTKQLKEVINEINNSEKAINEYNQAVQISNAYSDTNFKLVNKNKEGFIEYTEVIEQNKEELFNLQDEIDELTIVTEKLNAGHSLSKEEMEKLKQKYPELVSAMSKEKDQAGINEEAIIKLKNTKINSLEAMINAENNALILEGKILKQRLDNIGINIKGIENLDAARRASAGLAKQDYNNLYKHTDDLEKNFNSKDINILEKGIYRRNLEITKGFLKGIEEEYDEKYSQNIYDYSQFLNMIDSLKNEVNSGSLDGTLDGVSGSPSSGGSSSTASQYKAEIDHLLSFKNAIDKTNNSIQETDKLLSSSNLTHQKRIELLTKQVSLYKQQQSNVHNLAEGYRKERQQLTQLLANQGFKFTGSGDNLTISNLNHLQGKTKEVEETFNRFFDIQLNLIPQLQQQWLDLANSIDASIFEKINTQLNIYIDLQEELDRELSIINSKKSLYNEDSEEYLTLIAQEIQLIREKQNQSHLEAEYIREQLKLEELSIDKKIELNKRVKELGASWWDYEAQIKAVNDALRENIVSTNSSIANDIISAIKTGYQKMLELEKATVQEKIDLAQEEHDGKIKLLDDWLDHHNEIIDEMLEDLDKLYATEDYEEKLEELTNEQSEAEKKLQIALNLSDTAVDKDLRIQQAQEELNEVTKEIEELMRDRARNLRKEELEETKDKNQEIVEDKKESEKDKLESVKEAAEEEIAIIEEKYDKLINNDKMYEEIREEIMKGTYTRANQHITTILNNLQKYNYSTVLNMQQSWQDLENAIYAATKAKESFMDIQNPDDIELPELPELDLGNSGVEEYPGQSSEGDEKLKRDIDYLISQVRRARQIIKNRLSEGLDVSTQENYLEKLRNIGLKYHNVNIDKYHDGGIVGKPSNKMIGLVDKLFNTKPNEVIVKSLVGELQVPPKNVFSNFIPNMQNMINNVIPQQHLATSTGDITYNINMNIDKLNGNKEGGKTAFNELIKEIRKRGGTL